MSKRYTVFLKGINTSSTCIETQVELANFFTNKEEGWREADFIHPRTGRKTRARKEAASTAWFETYDIELFTSYHNLETRAKKEKERIHTGNKTEDATNWVVYAEVSACDCVVSALLSPNPLTVLRRKIERATEERNIYHSGQDGYKHHQHVIDLCEVAIIECRMCLLLEE